MEDRPDHDQSSRVDQCNKGQSGLKGLCHEMNNFLQAYYDKYVLSVYALIVFTTFCFLLELKHQTQSFSLLL
jgi:hypothetical protein